jgi:signal peptidase II
VRSRAPLRTAAAGILIAVLAGVVLAADQLSKYLAITYLPAEEPVEILGEFLQFYLIRNPGAAFSLGEGVTWLFTIALAAVAGVIVWLAFTRVRSRRWAVVLGLLLGGVLGNLTDRLVREPGFPVGHVVDFVLTPWMWFWTTPAIYNIADIFIVTMMIGVALLVLVGLRLDGTRERRDQDSDDPDAITGDEVATESITPGADDAGTSATEPPADPRRADGGAAAR